jgi:hypothetical protein
VIYLIPFVLWTSFLWRLRGGAFQALTGINTGTQVARIVCSIGIAAPLVWLHDDWWLALLAPALLLGLIIAGWGPFQGMDAGKFSDAHSPVTWVFDHIGLRVGVSPWRCYLGMAAAGVVCMAPSGAVIGWDFEAVRGAFVALGGVGFSPLYLAAYKLRLPYRTGGFVDWTTAWAELFVGALIGALLFIALIGA